ncbi:hypothetical protein KX928_12090 [Roseobacter sp. YSTF-M11]|uniref:Uncharacterized protein n=1 Tax=Roseobacter insulae TaxID=2859783 RepID=A0A9X1K2H0_9RHOB|nr:hypothetical protein [Roseobacter insulae]MBW4708523.1 hypothetical protein [Roseobacter insulae]
MVSFRKGVALLAIAIAGVSALASDAATVDDGISTFANTTMSASSSDGRARIGDISRAGVI